MTWCVQLPPVCHRRYQCVLCLRVLVVCFWRREVDLCGFLFVFHPRRVVLCEAVLFVLKNTSAILTSSWHVGIKHTYMLPSVSAHTSSAYRDLSGEMRLFLFHSRCRLWCWRGWNQQEQYTNCPVEQRGGSAAPPCSRCPKRREEGGILKYSLFFSCITEWKTNPNLPLPRSEPPLPHQSLVSPKALGLDLDMEPEYHNHLSEAEAVFSLWGCLFEFTSAVWAPISSLKRSSLLTSPGNHVSTQFSVLMYTVRTGVSVITCTLLW